MLEFTRSTLPSPQSYQDQEVLVVESDGSRTRLFSDGLTWDETVTVPSAQAAALQALAAGGGILGFTEISAQLTAGSSAAASANTATLNALFASGGQFSISKPGTYYIQLTTVPSNTKIYIGLGVVLKKQDSYYGLMLVNRGALLATPEYDSDIWIFGEGTIDGNFDNNSAQMSSVPGALPNTFQYGVQGNVSMCGVNRFVFAVRNTIRHNAFGIQYFGDTALFDGVESDVDQDVFHINGPSRNITINRCNGYANDDFIALNAWDWRRSSAMVGDIDGVTINQCSYYGAKRGNRIGTGIKFLSGTRTGGYGAGTARVRNVKVNGFVHRPSVGTVTPANAGILFYADYDILAAEYAGAGTVENIEINGGYLEAPNGNCKSILISKSSAAGGAADGQNSLTLRSIKITNVHCDASAGTCTEPIKFDIPYLSCTVQGFEVGGQWTPRQSGAPDQSYVRFVNKTMADSIKIRDLTINATSATGSLAVFSAGQYTSGVAAVVDRLDLDGVETANGFQITTPWLRLDGGIVNLMVCKRARLTGSGAGADYQGISIQSATSQLVEGVIESSYFNGLKLLLYLSAAAGSTRLTFRDTRVVNCTHPLFLTGAASADVTVTGGSINSGTNLARVANAGASLVMSLQDTVTSGGGASTITVASGTARLRRSDRVSFSPTVVLTPADGDEVNFSGTPAYAGVNVISGTGAGRYIYRGTGTVGWLKLN